MIKENEVRVEKAVGYYNSGFCCAQAVFATFAKDYGISEELALKLGSSFGGGARKGEMCGAVTGALMVLALKYGFSNAEALEEKDIAKKKAAEFMESFAKKNGTVVCRQLLGYDISKPEDMKKIRELGLFQTL